METEASSQAWPPAVNFEVAFRIEIRQSVNWAEGTRLGAKYPALW